MATSFFVWSSWDLSEDKSQSLVKRVDLFFSQIRVREIRFMLSSGYSSTAAKKIDEIFLPEKVYLC
jgi:hypothetical protein